MSVLDAVTVGQLIDVIVELAEFLGELVDEHRFPNGAAEDDRGEATVGQVAHVPVVPAKICKFMYSQI